MIIFNRNNYKTPNMHTSTINNTIYSIDMMIAYINIMKPDIIEVNVKDYKSALEYKGWGKVNIDKIKLDQEKSKEKKEKYIYKLPPILLKKKKKKIKTVPKDNGKYSAKDVLENKDKYKKDYEMIKESKLNYPIIIYKSKVIDGIHRLAKAHIKGIKKIKAVKFTDKLMNTFILDKRGNYQKALSHNIHTLINMFYESHIKSFCNSGLQLSNKVKYGLLSKSALKSYSLIKNRNKI